MRIFKDKSCRHCGEQYTPTGSSSFFCSIECRTEYYKSMGIYKEYRDRFAGKNGAAVGIGSGRHTRTGHQNHMFSHGRYAFRNFARKLKLLGVPCADCGKDLKEASRGEWCGHHKDHNPTNNHLNNLVLLCKYCHHMHHESYRNFPSLKNVQRLSRKGVGNSVPEAQSILMDDDIV